MPRTGGIYSEPAGTKGVSGQTIQSVPYNSFIDDLVTDANFARPVTAGGTGASTASAARTNLGVAIGTDVQAYDADLAAIAALVSAANKLPYSTGAGTWALTDFSAYGRTLVDDADAAAARTTLGAQALDTDLTAIAALTSAADQLPYATGAGTWAMTTMTAAARTVLDDATAGAMLTTLGGQPLDTDLTAIAALTSAADKVPYATGAGTWALADFSSFARTLLDDANAAAALTTLGAQPLDADLTAIASAGVGILSNYLSGFTLSNNVTDAVNDIDVAAGVCMDSTNAAFLSLAAITKRLDAAWAVGSGNGGLDTGAIANTTYHVFAIKRTDTGVVDALFSTSATAPTMPTNYTLFRRVGSIIRSGATILAFSQDGDEYLLDAAVLDVDTSSQDTTAILRTLTVPAGIKVTALMRTFGSCASAWSMLFSSPDVTSAAASGTAAPLADTAAALGTGDRAVVRVRTNTSRQIRTVSSAASTILRIATYGWIDSRGR